MAPSKSPTALSAVSATGAPLAEVVRLAAMDTPFVKARRAQETQSVSNDAVLLARLLSAHLRNE
jgi:hypothetical protein